jgi:hypothetical protein
MAERANPESKLETRVHRYQVSHRGVAVESRVTGESSWSQESPRRQSQLRVMVESGVRAESNRVEIDMRGSRMCESKINKFDIQTGAIYIYVQSLVLHVSLGLCTCHSARPASARIRYPNKSESFQSHVRVNSLRTNTVEGDPGVRNQTSHERVMRVNPLESS